MKSTSDHEVQQPSRQNTVESHPLPSTTPDLDTVKRQPSIGTLPSPSPMPKPTSSSEKERGPFPSDTHPGARTEMCDWHGPVRAKLTKDGYRNLAVMCTFVAGVQAQLLQMTYTQTDKSSQIINALFFAGLFADIGAAILSASSARWFEMLTPEEAENVYDWVLKEKGSSSSELEAQIPADEHDKDYFVVERWLSMGLKSGLYAALIGLGLLATGVMLYVWAHMPMIVQVMGTVSCACVVLLLPPFFLPHDRVQTLRYVKLQRFSGRDVGHHTMAVLSTFKLPHGVGHYHT